MSDQRFGNDDDEGMCRLWLWLVVHSWWEVQVVQKLGRVQQSATPRLVLGGTFYLVERA